MPDADEYQRRSESLRRWSAIVRGWLMLDAEHGDLSARDVIDRVSGALDAAAADLMVRAARKRGAK